MSDNLPKENGRLKRIRVKVSQAIKRCFFEAGTREATGLGIQLLLAVIGVFAVGVYWKQLSEMKAQSEIARGNLEILKSQTLPFIVSLGTDFIQPLEPYRAIEISDNFVNAGNSPAFNVHSRVNTQVIADNSSPQFIFKTITGSSAVLAPKEKFDTPIILPAPSPEEAEKIKNGLVKIYVVGEVRYTDMFHRDHQTQYCQLYDPPSQKMLGCSYNGVSN